MKNINQLIPVRLQIKRTKGFKLVIPNELPIVYVGRGTKWGNPFKVVEVADNEWHVVAKENDTWNVLLKTSSHDEALVSVWASRHKSSN